MRWECSVDNSLAFNRRYFIQRSRKENTPGATYAPLNNNHQPTTAKAGISFPGNDWIAFPNGDQYLAKLGAPSPKLLNELAVLRQRHLQAVANLLNAIEKGKVSVYLKNQFKCPAQ